MSGPVDINQDEAATASSHFKNHVSGATEIEKSMNKSMTQFSLPAAGAGVTAAQYLQTLMTSLKTFIDRVKQNAADADAGIPLTYSDVEISLATVAVETVVANAPAVAKGTAPVSVKYDELVPDLYTGDYYQDTEGDLLFPNGKPTIGDIDQGNLGDCWLLAAIGSMVAVDPQRVKDLIQDNGDGTYTVHMAKGGDVVVDGSMLPNTNDDNAKWVKIIEYAYAQNDGGSYQDLWGGESSDAMKDIFGLDSESYDPESGFTVRKHKDPEKAFDDIEQAVASGKPVSVNVYGHGLGNHELSVIGLTTVNGERCIAVRNPWGRGSKDWNGNVVARGGTVDSQDESIVYLPADAAGELIKKLTVGQ